MRTTVTLDEDVEAKIRQIMHERGESMQQVINWLLRTAVDESRKPAVPFRSRTYRMGTHEAGAFDEALAMAAAMEDAEAVRKLSARE